MTNGAGTVQERALMYAILRRIPELKPYRAQLEVAMTDYAVSAWNNWCRDFYEKEVRACHESSRKTYLPYMVDRVRKALYQGQREGSTLLEEVKALCRAIRRSGNQRVGSGAVIGKLRRVFAQISLDRLEPGLVIMDEFQRFKFLLTAAPDSEVGMLAGRFFHTEGLRMLMLSATPYKMYSTLEEIDESQVDAHYAEFLDVMKFLTEGRENDFLTIWNGYSVRLKELSRGDTTILQAKRAAEDAMYQMVCRTERCSAGGSADLMDDSDVKHPVKVGAEDIRSFVQAQALLDQIGAPFRVPADYIKSTPYLLSFMRDYQLNGHYCKGLPSHSNAH